MYYNVIDRILKFLDDAEMIALTDARR